MAVRHHPYCHPDLGTGSKTLPDRNSSVAGGVNASVERTFRTP
jgi:hypothetical protein